LYRHGEAKPAAHQAAKPRQTTFDEAKLTFDVIARLPENIRSQTLNVDELRL
jgi:hypothetical protein